MKKGILAGGEGLPLAEETDVRPSLFWKSVESWHFKAHLPV